MKRVLLILAWAVFAVVFFSAQSWAVCPEDPNDNGECDTFYVEVYPPDHQFQGSPPYFVRFPIYVTHDVPTPWIDSIAAFQIALGWEHSNVSNYCSLNSYWNNTNLYPFPETERSVFRHLIEDGDTLVHNWMMDLSQKLMGLEWDTRILDLYGNTNFWLALFPTGSQDQRFGEGSRVLLAAMTFKLEDTTTVFIDEDSWPPGDFGVVFARSDAVTYRPRHFFPVCELLGLGAPPQVGCPEDQHHHTDGQFAVSGFSAYSYSKVIESLSAEFVGDGVGEVWFDNVVGLGTESAQGDVVYEVTNHCAGGGTIILTAVDDAGAKGSCDLQVTFSNDPPGLILQDTVRALTRHTFGLEVPAADPDNDSVVTTWNALWYESNPPQPPTNYPSHIPGNPGHFTWQVTEADTGIWISSFSATDACGAIDTQRVTIHVGIPFCGDCNENGFIDPGDVISLMNYLFRQGTPPEPLCRGDANCNGDRDVGDAVLLINYLYKSGVPPCFECCAGQSTGGLTEPESPE